MYTDTFDKIVRYFSAVAEEPFTYKGKKIEPKVLQVSPGIFRGYECPPGCGGCCMRFSLTYLPHEPQPLNLSPRFIEFNGQTYVVYEDPQMDHDDHYCRFLNKQDGRCLIHGEHPFSCDFELLRFFHHEKKVRLNQQLFGRGWSFTRVDGEKGALCSITPPSPYWRREAIRKVQRLQEWADYFELSTKLDLVLLWLRTGPHTTPLVLPARTRRIAEFLYRTASE